MRLLIEAARVARESVDGRPFLLGCVAKRKDGAYVYSYNSHSNFPLYAGHAEARALRKAGSGAIIWVARVLRKNGEWAMARPCGRCQALIKNRKVKKVYYTIGPNEYGIWKP